MKKNYFIGAGLIALIIIGRFVPHMPNVTPVTAVALAAAVYLNGINRWLIPLVGMLITDIFIGFYALPIMVSVYASFVGTYFIGLCVKRNKTALTVIAATLGSSLLFFLITNFAVWALGTWYAHTFAGLVNCYTLALPFFRSMLTGDILYTIVVFGAFELARAYKPISILQNNTR